MTRSYSIWTQKWVATLVVASAFALVNCASNSASSSRTSSASMKETQIIAPRSVPFFEMFQLGMPGETVRAVAGTFSKRGNWVASKLLISEKQDQLSFRLPLKAIQYRQQRSVVLPGASKLTLVTTGSPRKLTRVELIIYGWPMDKALGTATLRKYLGQLYPWFKAEPVGDSMGFRLTGQNEEISLKVLYQSERMYAAQGGIPEPTPYFTMVANYQAKSPAPPATTQPAASSTTQPAAP
jgi:hypothetical protein